MAKKKSNSPAKVSNAKTLSATNSKKVDTTYIELKKELERLQGLEFAPYPMTTKFRFNINQSTYIDIAKVTDRAQLFIIYSGLLMSEEYYYKSVKEIYRTDKEIEFYEHDGHSADQWKSIIKQRIEVIDSVQQIKDLEELIENMSEFVSVESKASELMAKAGKYREKYSHTDNK